MKMNLFSKKIDEAMALVNSLDFVQMTDKLINLLWLE